MPDAYVTTTTAQYVIPEIWAARAMERLRSNIVLAKLVTRDSDIAAFNQGDVLHIPFPGSLTANSKAASTAVTLQAPSDSEVQVTLNKHKEVSFLVEDPVRAQQNQEILDRYVDSAAIALAEAIESDLFALYSGLSQSVGTSGTDLGAATIRSARKTLNDAKVPQAGRFGVISSKDEVALLADSGLANYFAFRGQQLKEGALGHLYGFDLYMSQLVPVVGSGPASTKNVFGSAQMAILAMRSLPEPPPGSGAVATVLRDRESGLVLRVVASYNPSFLGVQVTVDVLYGVAELRDAAGVVVLS